MLIKRWSLLLILIFACTAQSSIQRYTLSSGKHPILPLPLSINLDTVPNDDLSVTRIDGTKRIPLATQLENSQTPRLWFIPDKTIPAGESIVIELQISEKKKTAPCVKVTTNDETITLSANDKPILAYQIAMKDVPVGVDPLFKRNAYIHPLWSPNGDVLTKIQPKDHYHHYGIWNPWTKTKVEGQAVDFWNLKLNQGRVRYAGVLSTLTGPVYGGFKVLQEHVANHLPGNQVAIREVWDVRVTPCQLDNQTVWLFDLSTTLNNALMTPIELTQYRYGGGLGFRAADDWTKQTVSVLTSEGHPRDKADGTRARWCDTRRTLDDGKAGILFCSHTANTQHPEPMRVWPSSTQNGEGLFFFEFCPIRHYTWQLEPQQDYILRYRMVVYNGTISPETAEAVWQQFTSPPMIKEQP